MESFDESGRHCAGITMEAVQDARLNSSAEYRS